MPNTKLIEGKILKQVAGAFATGISVVTTNRANGDIHGVTINSFLSISLSPPLVGFCLKKEAFLYSLLSIGKKVGISILKESQETISKQFAGKNETNFLIDFEKKGDVFLIPEAHAWYSTQVDKIIPLGDHYLIVCLINDLERREAFPLIYYSGYKKIKS